MVIMGWVDVDWSELFDAERTGREEMAEAEAAQTQGEHQGREGDLFCACLIDIDAPDGLVMSVFLPPSVISFPPRSGVAK